MATIAETEPYVEIDPESIPDESRYEVVDGRVVELPSMGVFPNHIAADLFIPLGQFIKREKVGWIIAETLFRLAPKQQRRPDIAFVSYERWPARTRLSITEPWEVVPDLAIEIISKNDNAWDVLGKTREYLEAGSKAVWLVYPIHGEIHIFDHSGQIRVFRRDDEFDGGVVLPGFRLAMAGLFGGEPADEEPGP